MSEYKLVPVEPTPKMLQVWKSMHGYSRYNKYKAMLAAAPTLQGEPVAWMTHRDEPMFFATAREASAYCDHDENPIPLYATQQPAPDASGLVVTLKSIEEWVMRYADPKHPVATVARKALADYRKQGGEA